MAFERLLNSVHKTHIVFENLSNIEGDMLQKPWGLNFGKDGMIVNRQCTTRIKKKKFPVLHCGFNHFCKWKN